MVEMIHKKRISTVSSWSQVPQKESGAGFAGNFQMSPNSVLQKVYCTSSAGEGKTQTADKVTLTTGNMLYMLSSTGLEEGRQQGLDAFEVSLEVESRFLLVEVPDSCNHLPISCQH